MTTFVERNIREPETKRGFFLYRHGLMHKTKVLMSVEHGTLILFDSSTWCIVHRFSLYNGNININNNILKIKFPLITKNGYEITLQCEDTNSIPDWINTINNHINYSNELDQWKLKRLKELGETDDLLLLANAIGHNNMMSAVKNKKKKMNDSDEDMGIPELPHLKGITSEATVDNIKPPDQSIPGIEIYFAGSNKIEREEDEEEPPSCQGWLIKKGEAHNNIKLRFFSLQNGHLRYFTTDNIPVQMNTTADAICSTAATTSRAVCKARLNIYGYEVHSNPTEGTIKIELIPGSESVECRRHLELYCDDHADKVMWTRALLKHVNFKSN